MAEDESRSGRPAPDVLEPRLCQVVGVNQNYTSSSGTLYHIQVEDRGPIRDRVTDRPLRRVSVVVFANYGEPSARIIHGRDHDFEDVRTAEHNRFVARQVQELAAGARGVIEEKEAALIARIKTLVRSYYETKDDEAKREFEQANALYPFLFSRAWSELRRERAAESARSAEPARAPRAAAPPPVPFDYPLDPRLREQVLDIERIVADLESDLRKLEARGAVDAALVQSCRKLIDRASEVLAGQAPTEFTLRRLEMTRASLATAWRQLRSMLR